MKKKYIWFTATFIYCVAIFVTTASPASTGGNTMAIFAQFFHLSETQAAVVNVIFRKFVHLSAFGVLAILFFHCFEKRRFFLAWLCTTIYAGTDELHQAFLPDRTGTIIDVGIDSLGALLALILISMMRFRKHRAH